VSTLFDNESDSDDFGWSMTDLQEELSMDGPASDLILDEFEDEIDFTDDADDDDEDIDRLLAEDDLPGRISRRTVASRARRVLSGRAGRDETYEAGLFAGYARALRDQGHFPESYGGAFWGTVGRGVGRLAIAGARGYMGGKTAEELAQEVGSGVREGSGMSATMPKDLGRTMAERVTGGGAVETSTTAPPAAAEVTAEDLPPTYVADDAGFSDDLDALGGDLDQAGELSEGLELAEVFGSTARSGLIERQGRHRAASAAESSLYFGAAALRNAVRSAPSVFVADNDAEPVMFAGGQIWEPAYGRVHAVPCPSCARLTKEATSYGAGTTCAVCDAFGAILVPESDLSQYASSRYGAFFLLPVAIGAGTAFAETEQGQEWVGEGKERVSEWLEEQDFFGDSDSDDQDSDIFYSSERIRAIIPEGWTPTGVR